MSFSSHIFANCAKTTALLLMAALTFSYADKPLKGKVRYAVGEVNRQKAKQDDWKPLKTFATVEEADKIKTEEASQATIAFPDGSILSVEENSLVEIKILSSDDGGSQHAMADIKEGKVGFNAQTQPLGNTMQFRTGTATAAIRGTSGAIVALKDNQSLISLATGLMALSVDKSHEEMLNPQQTSVTIPERFKKEEKFAFFKAVSSGNISFVKGIVDIIEKNSSEASSYDEWFYNISVAVTKADQEFQKKLADAKARLNCQFDNLPDTTTTKMVTIKGRCSSIISKMQVNGENFENIPTSFENTLTWNDITAPGLQKVTINCEDEQSGITFECGKLSTYYNPSQNATEAAATSSEGVSITSKQPLEADESGYVNIEGTYDPNNIVSIIVSIGSRSTKNLVSKSGSGEFFATIPVSDEIGNWNEDVAIVTYTTKNGAKKEENLELSIDKSKKAVNITSSKIQFISADSVSKCAANIALGNVKGDQVIFTTMIDGTPVSEKRYTDNAKITAKLKPGKHSYKFVATDMAGNKQELNKELGCYALSSGKISINGSAYERLRVPPPPSGIDPTIRKNLKFKVENIPGRNPDYLKRVTVKKNGIILFQQQSQFEDISFDIPIDLNRGTKNVFQVEVVLKNRSVLTATKTYEVR